jgi:hypothetical protein
MHPRAVIYRQISRKVTRFVYAFWIQTQNKLTSDRIRTCETGGSHGGNYEEYCLVGYDDVWCGV